MQYCRTNEELLPLRNMVGCELPPRKDRVTGNAVDVLVCCCGTMKLQLMLYNWVCAALGQSVYLEVESRVLTQCHYTHTHTIPTPWRRFKAQRSDLGF